MCSTSSTLVDERPQEWNLEETQCPTVFHLFNKRTSEPIYRAFSTIRKKNLVWRRRLSARDDHSNLRKFILRLRDSHEKYPRPSVQSPTQHDPF
ncbi:hypothetical protein CDAR_471431 [Caerostris darwini]|uniref:Uncharacterized protein n=1 Tax=Caerostris darwini TaxID=1538125 RepID=A0AAV4RNQ1_9ARAC|nr:hypothetical protein CDAR_471431 [Caerostris darwini]